MLDFVSTNQPMGLSGTWLWIRWGFHSLPIAQSANVTDDTGLLEMLRLNIDYFKSKPVNIAKTTILLDHGYHPASLIEELEKVYPQIMTKIRFERSTKPSKQEKAEQGKSGFVPAVAWWVIERSNAWMERCKSLTNSGFQMSRKKPKSLNSYASR